MAVKKIAFDEKDFVSRSEYMSLSTNFRVLDQETRRLATEKEKLKGELSKAKRRIRDLEYDKTRKKPTPASAEVAVGGLPNFMQPTAREIVTDASMKEVVMDVLERRGEFREEHVALLAGIGMNMKARDHFDKMLDTYWSQAPKIPYDEIIIGGGLHAAIYAACRVRRGFPRPLVIEKSKHPGGVFACSTRPAFYLNSRNRPGMSTSVPGDSQPLNYLPGCELQPADMGGEEYQTNDVLAWVIRCNLALNADVWAGKEVGSFRNSGRLKTIFNMSGRELCCATKHIIVAIGPGQERSLISEKSKRIVTFQEFMGMMSKPFPMRGLRRIAVLGPGDSGKAAIEALTGQGPSMLTASSLDFPEVHWYGVPSNQRGRTEWETCNRSRYKGIGRLLTVSNDRSRNRRVVLKGKPDSYAARTVEDGIDSAYVDGQPYDLVVECIGFTGENVFNTRNYNPFRSDQGGSSIAGVSSDAYTIGVCAGIAPSSLDLDQFKGITENGTSIFYLARKTEKLAMALN